MSTIPELPPAVAWMLSPNTVTTKRDMGGHPMYRADAVRSIQLAAYRAGLEAAKLGVQGLAYNEMHAGSPRRDVQRTYGDGFRRAREDACDLIDSAIRAIEPPPAE